MSDTVSWNLQVNVREGQLEDFRALMQEMVSATQANEPGTLAYEWFLNEDGSACHIYERYSDSAAVMTHLGAFDANFGARFLESVEPTALSVYGEPSADVRGVLDGFGAKYLGPFGGFAR